MTIITDENKIDEILTRSIQEILPTKEKLKELLLSGKQLRIYIGADATGPALHLGHATNFILLEKFRQLGHKVIILIGDFTARIGDPTDKTATRVQLDRESVIENTKTWLEQLKPIVDLNNKDNPVEIVYNHDWLSKMTFEDVINLSSNFTVQQMLERDMFEKRIKENKPIYLHEFFYPLMQGYDSVHLDIDMEIVGSDQKFNALTGRTLVQRYNKKEKFILITPLLENPITKEKMMSKSLGTGIFLNMSANDMFGGIMAQPDENIHQLFTDCTYFTDEEIKAFTDKIKSGTNPRDIKILLGKEIVHMYHSQEDADKAEQYFINTFTKKEIPDDVDEITPTDYNIVNILIESKLAESKSEARRVIDQGGVKVNGEVVKNLDMSIDKDSVIQKGKMGFIKVK